MMRNSGTVRIAVTVACALALLLGAQAFTYAQAPDLSGGGAGAALGRAGSAYLGGLRRFAAAVLWNRLEPVFHEYYGNMTLAEQKFAMPTMRMVTLLDPQFEQAYYVAALQVAEAGHMDEGVGIARDGLANNPDSGLMRLNLAQLLLIQDRDANRDANRSEIIRLAKEAAGPDIHWVDLYEEDEALRLIKGILTWGGQDKIAEQVDRRLEEVQNTPGFDVLHVDHDHDGDGVPDH